LNKSSNILVTPSKSNLDAALSEENTKRVILQKQGIKVSEKKIDTNFKANLTTLPDD
jgi:hypothetical protein